MIVPPSNDVAVHEAKIELREAAIEFREAAEKLSHPAARAFFGVMADGMDEYAAWVAANVKPRPD